MVSSCVHVSFTKCQWVRWPVIRCNLMQRVWVILVTVSYSDSISTFRYVADHDGVQACNNLRISLFCKNVPTDGSSSSHQLLKKHQHMFHFNVTHGVEAIITVYDNYNSKFHTVIHLYTIMLFAFNMHALLLTPIQLRKYYTHKASVYYHQDITGINSCRNYNSMFCLVFNTSYRNPAQCQHCHQSQWFISASGF